MTQHASQEQQQELYTLKGVIEILQQHPQNIKSMTLDWDIGSPQITVEYYEQEKQTGELDINKYINTK